MGKRVAGALEPRKSPVQARSAASVDAILEATIQVLLSVGKERLTTTRVAARAGVSVGTLYQYFPNKSALLQAALKGHLSAIFRAVESACREQEGKPLRDMVTALVTAFLQAKLKDEKTSVALYSVMADVDGIRIAQHMGVRFHRLIVRMLASSCEPVAEPELVGFMLQSAITGVGRSLLDAGPTQMRYEAVRQELIRLGCAYLNEAGTATHPLQHSHASPKSA